MHKQEAVKVNVWPKCDLPKDGHKSWSLAVTTQGAALALESEHLLPQL